MSDRIKETTFLKIERDMNKTIDESELASMAREYFDSDSAAEMIAELKKDIRKDLGRLVVEPDPE